MRDWNPYDWPQRPESDFVEDSDADDPEEDTNVPYIPTKARQQARWAPDNAGELNFAIHEMLAEYADPNLGRPPSYALYNEIIGVLECVKLEFYRRLVGPYEDHKRVENGDVKVYAG